MKIGILTLPFNNNYGGYLQAYALLTLLKSMGHQVELIYRRNNRRSKKRRLKYTIKNLLKKIIGHKVISILPNQEIEHRSKGRLMMKFVDKFIQPISKPLYSSSAMYKYIRRSNYDMVIIGSDQVWRPDYGQKHVQDFFLTKLNYYCHKSPRIVSYAASFGADEPCYTDVEKKECGDAILRFEAVSVREQKGVDIISSFKWKCKNIPKVVLDPTFLLTTNHYKSLLQSEKSKSLNRIFCYNLDYNEESSEIQKFVESFLGLESFNIIDTQNWQSRNYIMPSIEDWLCGIRDAAFVLTDSYHGMVFSIIFNKSFLVRCNKSRGANRFTTVLSALNLEDRLVFNADNIAEKLTNNIDWESVNAKLEFEIAKSQRFLSEALL